MAQACKSIGESIEDGYNNNDNETYEIIYPSSRFLFDEIKVKTFESSINIDIFIIFRDEKELIEEGQKKNFKSTVNFGPEYKFVFDTLKKYTNLSKQRINQKLKNEVFIYGGTSTHTCTVSIPVDYITIP